MKYDVKMYLCSDSGKKFFGKGPVQLLQEIDSVHSIKQAATNLDISFSKALSMIHTAEKEYDMELLVKKTGGKGGGGSQLTLEARQLLDMYAEFEEKARASVEAVFNQVFCERAL